MSLIFLSSWSDKLYEVSGKHLLDSYMKFGPISESSFVYYDDYYIESLPTFKVWFEQNKDIIPDYFGGLAKPCDCRKPHSRQDRDHFLGCRYSWWNRNVYRWVKKVFALNECILNQKPSTIIWLDSDCFFQKKVTLQEIDNWFGDSDIFYFKGPQRKIEEMGIVGYRTHSIFVKSFIEEYLDIYMSNQFRKLRRWDDCYSFQKLRLRNGRLLFRDLGGNVTEMGDVISNSVIGPYITHDKGRHGRKLGLIR